MESAIATLESGLLAPAGAVLIKHILQPLDDAVGVVFPSYHAFLKRPMPQTTALGGDCMGDWFWIYTVMWTTIFSVIFLAIPVLGKYFFPVWWNGPTMRTTVKSKKDGKERTIDYGRDFSSYCVCLLHHIYVVPRSWYRIHQDYNLPASQWAGIDYGPIDYVVAPFLLGYLLSDSICYALPNLSTEYILHHVLTIGVTLGGLKANNYLSRFIPHLLVVDTTQLFYNTAWLLKRFGFRDENPLCLTLEILFAVTFPIVRIFILPMAFLNVTLNGAAKGFGILRFTFLPLCLLQYFWLYKIINRLMKMFAPKKASSRSERGRKAD